MDIDGTDAAQKLAILSSLAFGTWIDYRDVYQEGITHLQPIDFQMAREFEYRIKSLAIARHTSDGLSLCVYPAFVPISSSLAHVDGEMNAVEVVGDPMGPSILEGRGAGGGPTASSVVSDIVDLGRNLMTSALARVPVLPYAGATSQKPGLLDFGKSDHQYYIRLRVVDRPGALAAITQILGRHQISIASLYQKERGKAKPVPVILLTHDVNEKNMSRALEEIESLEVIVDRPRVDPHWTFFLREEVYGAVLVWHYSKISALPADS